MEDKKVLKAEELSEDELDQAAGGFTADAISKSQKAVKSIVTKGKADASKSVKSLTDNKSIVKNFVNKSVEKD